MLRLNGSGAVLQLLVGRHQSFRFKKNFLGGFLGVVFLPELPPSGRGFLRPWLQVLPAPGSCTSAPGEAKSREETLAKERWGRRRHSPTPEFRCLQGIYVQDGGNKARGGGVN